MKSIVHISDTHFGTEKAPVKAALIEAVNQLAPDVLVWSGDITQRARRKQFLKAKNFLGSLNYKELICLPGNHDIPLYNLPVRFFAPYSGFQRFFPAKHSVNRVVSEPLAIIGVNSCNPKHYKNGFFSNSLIREVEQFLLSVPSNWLKVVVAHHPVDVIQESDTENIVVGAEFALSRWSAAGMDIIMGGHIHFQFSRELNIRYPHVSPLTRVVQAGTAMSSRVRYGLPNSFFHLQVPSDKHESVIECWDYSKEIQGFSPSASGQLFREPTRLMV